MDAFLDTIERILILIGGDPTTLDKAATADSQIATLVTFHANHPIPSNLTDAQRTQIIQDIRDLHAATFFSDPSVSPAALLALRASLESMWVQLGLLLSDLN